MEQTRRFTGFFISAALIEDSRLNWTDRIIFAEIDALETPENACFASNKHFADMLNITERSVINSINTLKACKYVYQDGFNGRVRQLRVSPEAGSLLHGRREVNFTADVKHTSPRYIINLFENTNESDARTREASDFKNILLGCSKNLSLEDQKERMNLIQKELFNSNDFQERIMRRFGFKKEAIEPMIVNFLNDIWAKEDFYKPLSEVKKHCISWIGARTERRAV